MRGKSAFEESFLLRVAERKLSLFRTHPEPSLMQSEDEVSEKTASERDSVGPLPPLSSVGNRKHNENLSTLLFIPFIFQ
jgi:hypothetical protein